MGNCNFKAEQEKDSHTCKYKVKIVVYIYKDYFQYVFDRPKRNLDKVYTSLVITFSPASFKITDCRGELRKDGR